MNCHLSRAQSCRWYMSGKFRAWDEEEGDTNTCLPQDADYVEEDDYHASNDTTNLHSIISQLNLGPQDTFFLQQERPADITADGAGPGPETNRLCQAALSHHIFDDDSDERTTITFKQAGEVRRKELPPALWFNQDKDEDGDAVMDRPEKPPLSHFHPFNSDLDWRIAQWAIKDGPGQNAFDRLLSVPGVCVGRNFQ